MAVTMTLPALPSSFGGTIIQASTLLLQSADYKNISWANVRRFANTIGMAYFVDRPFGKEAEDPEWLFYIRGDMSGGASGQTTLIGIRTRNFSATRTPAGTSTPYQAPRRRIDVYAWHIVTVTLTSGGIYTDVILSLAGATILTNPEDGTMVTPTNGYQTLHEALGLLLQPVAGNVPNWNPAYAGAVGLNPNI